MKREGNPGWEKRTIRGTQRERGPRKKVSLFLSLSFSLREREKERKSRSKAMRECSEWADMTFFPFELARKSGNDGIFLSTEYVNRKIDLRICKNK